MTHTRLGILCVVAMLGGGVLATSSLLLRNTKTSAPIQESGRIADIGRRPKSVNARISDALVKKAGFDEGDERGRVIRIPPEPPSGVDDQTSENRTSPNSPVLADNGPEVLALPPPEPGERYHGFDSLNRFEQDAGRDSGKEVNATSVLEPAQEANRDDYPKESRPTPDDHDDGRPLNDAKPRPALLLQSARNAVQLGDLELAADRYADHIAEHPQDNEARLELSGILSELGRVDKAAIHLERLTQVFPHNLLYLRRYADLLLQVSDYLTAELPLRKLVEHPDYQIDAAIDLAHVLRWTDRKEEAIATVERNLEVDHPLEWQQRIRFAELLTGIDRPTRALAVLQPLSATHASDLSVLRIAVLASAMTGDDVGAMEAIGRLSVTHPREVDSLDELAKRLRDLRLYRAAVAIDQQILAVVPLHRDALLRNVRAYLHFHEPSLAASALDTLEKYQDDLEFMSAAAEYHAAIGEWADAIAACHRAISMYPNDASLRIALGHAYVLSGQYIRAAAEFSKVPMGTDPLSGQLHLDAQLSRARALSHARRFEDALTVINSAMASPKGRHSDQVLEAYVDVMTACGRYPMAIEEIRSRIRDLPDFQHRKLMLQAKLGLILVRSGDHVGALQEFKMIERNSIDAIPEVVYGKYRALVAVGNPELAKSQLLANFAPLSPDTYLRMRIAELATEDCDCCLARQVLQHLSRFCDHNIAIRNCLGEVCLQCESCEGVCNCAGHFVHVLKYSPTNVRAMLGLARLHARRGDLAQAMVYYHQAMRTMPDNVQIIREAARTMGNWKGPEAARHLYQTAIKRTNGEYLYELARSYPDQLAELEREFGTLNGLSSLVRKEAMAKQFPGWRPVSAIASFQDLLCSEPDNLDALFEIGQALSGMNRTAEAVCQYQRLLCVNPCSREARIAIARNQLEMSPQSRLFGDYDYQRGRDGLVDVSSLVGGPTFQLPLGDEDEFIRVGYARAMFDFPGAPQLNGDWATVRIQAKPRWWAMLWGQANYQTYDYGFDDRVNFDVGLRSFYLENAAIRIVGRQQNVTENGEAVLQDIHRAGVELGHYWQPTRRFLIDAFYRFWDYSDDNTAHFGGIYTSYALRQGRCPLRWLTNFDLQTFDEQTFRPNFPSLEDAVHPYFAPDDFVFLSTGLQCRRYLSCDSYKGANLHWYELFVGGRIDNDGKGYGLARGRMLRDIDNWLTFAAYASLVGSSVYDQAAAGAELTVRF